MGPVLAHFQKRGKQCWEGEGFTLRLLEDRMVLRGVWSGGRVGTWPQTELGLDPSTSSTPLLEGHEENAEHLPGLTPAA